MTQEEKAKAYDEALEKAKAHISNKGIGDTVDLCKHIFPELAESEDERVRKEIIHYILYKANGVSEKQEHEWIAYLEKQKEQKLAWSEEDEEMLEYVIGDVNDAKQLFATKEAIDLCDKEIAWLKSLRPSWKPNDKDEERLIKTSMVFLKDFADMGYENAVECIDWLKSKLNGNTCK